MLNPTPPSEMQAGNARYDLPLVQEVLRREPRAIERFIERMRCVPRFLGVLSRRLRAPLSSDELADLTQDTLALIWKKLAEYEGRATLETWSYRFCSLELQNWIRRRRRESGAPSVASGREFGAAPLDARTETGAETNEGAQPDVERVNMGLQRLRAEEAQVVRMKHYDELTFEEIATRIHAPASTAKALYYRGMEKLRGFLRPHVQGEEP